MASFLVGTDRSWVSQGVYRSLVLLHPGVLLVIDHIEKTWNSSTRYAGAIFHNRRSSFEVQEDQTGDQLASIMLNNKTHLFFWTNAHQGESTVQSQSNEWGAGVGKTKTHFFNITTNLAERRTRMASAFYCLQRNLLQSKFFKDEFYNFVYMLYSDCYISVSVLKKFPSGGI